MVKIKKNIRKSRKSRKRRGGILPKDEVKTNQSCQEQTKEIKAMGEMAKAHKNLKNKAKMC